MSHDHKSADFFVKLRKDAQEVTKFLRLNMTLSHDLYEDYMENTLPDIDVALAENISVVSVCALISGTLQSQAAKST